jgi:formamidopyrimidine-DNA glycosylase
MRLAVPGVTIDLIGPPTCELIDERGRRAVEARLGPDPLRRDGTLARFEQALLRRPDRAVGDALLDQRVAAGVGNIYRAEALFLLGIHPKTPVKRLLATERDALWTTLRDLLRRGVREGTIPLAPEERTDDGREFYVYGEEICRRCGGRITDFPLSGRRMYVCRACQPRRRRGGGIIPAAAAAG